MAVKTTMYSKSDDFVLLRYQPSQPFPCSLNLSGTKISVIPEIEEYENHSLENIMDCPNLADVK